MSQLREKGEIGGTPELAQMAFQPRGWGSLWTDVFLPSLPREPPP